MPTLLLRGDSSASLSALVEAAQKRTFPLPDYDLRLSDKHFELTPVAKPAPYPNDEGFESDIDSLSIVSNDSFTIEGKSPDSKTTETDSANGSSSSDSDNETAAAEKLSDSKGAKERFELTDCVCYTDVNSADLLILVVKGETFVFKFVEVEELHKFYANFTTLKALTNQKLYNRNFGTKFNLLQTTDQNGVTHIRVTREAELDSLKQTTENGPASIITFNETKPTPNKNKDVNSRQRITPGDIPKLSRCNSTENVLDTTSNPNIKVWNSAEDLLDTPKRPERRKKGKAPQPPAHKPQDVFSGQYVRVNVNFDPRTTNLDAKRLIIKSSPNEPHPKKLQSFKPTNLTSFLRKEKRFEPMNTLSRNPLSIDYNSWTNSVPRLLKKPKPRPEIKTTPPMAYRYIDTIQDYPMEQRSFLKNQSTPIFGQNAAFSNYLRDNQNFNGRLFGLSSKLKDFQQIDAAKDNNVWKTNSSEISGLNKDSNLKSVIKINKDDNIRKKNDKKVTFSAYTTVQVV